MCVCVCVPLFLIKIIILSLCGWTSVGNFVEEVSSFHLIVGSGEETQVSRTK